VLFTDPRLNPLDLQIISYYKLRYLVVDKRDSTALPADGHYFEGSEPVPGYRHPVARSALLKFGRAPCIDQVFSSGHLLIYDTEPLGRGCHEG